MALAHKSEGSGARNRRSEPPRARAPGAQMIRMDSGNSLAFQRLSRDTPNCILSVRLAKPAFWCVELTRSWFRTQLCAMFPGMHFLGNARTTMHSQRRKSACITSPETAAEGVATPRRPECETRACYWTRRTPLELKAKLARSGPPSQAGGPLRGGTPDTPSGGSAHSPGDLHAAAGPRNCDTALDRRTDPSHAGGAAAARGNLCDLWTSEPIPELSTATSPPGVCEHHPCGDAVPPETGHLRGRGTKSWRYEYYFSWCGSGVSLQSTTFCRTHQTRGLGPGVPPQARPPGGGGDRGEFAQVEKAGGPGLRPTKQACHPTGLSYKGVLTECYFLRGAEGIQDAPAPAFWQRRVAALYFPSGR
eukprot:gene25634-biopygen15051